MEILKEWIADRGRQPVTWNTLIEVLHDIELSTLVTEIEAANLPEGDEDRLLKSLKIQIKELSAKLCRRLSY